MDDDRNRDRRPTHRAAWGLALVLPVLAVALRLALAPVLGDRSPYILGVVAVVACAWAGGAGPAILALVLCSTLSVVLIIEPTFSLTVPTASGVASLGLFVLVTGVAAALTVHARGLAQTLRERNAELAASAERLARDAAVRRGFESMLSHEVRTPLTVILGQAALLRRRLADAPDGELAAMAADLEDEAERLRAIIEDLLVVNRDEAGRLEATPEPVLLGRTLGPIVARSTRRWPELVVEVDLAADLPAVAADPTLLEHVLVNLLSNAGKYGGPRPIVRITAAATDAGVVLRIADDGPGFGPGGAEHAFDLFWRDPASAARASGAGVGLHVARRLVEAMGGTIVLEPASDAGASFLIRLHRWEEDDHRVVATDDAGATAVLQPGP